MGGFFAEKGLKLREFDFVFEVYLEDEVDCVACKFFFVFKRGNVVYLYKL
jgi:hypothetical protein